MKPWVSKFLTLLCVVAEAARPVLGIKGSINLPRQSAVESSTNLQDIVGCYLF